MKRGIGLRRSVRAGDDDLEILARSPHEEFMLFAVVAASNITAHVTSFAFDAAKKLNGWGRVRSVRRRDGTQDPAIKE